MTRRLVLLLVAVAGLSLWMTGPASGHTGGKVELFVARLDVTPEGSTYTVRALVVDRDSGDPAAGFAVSVSGVGPAGQSLSSLALDDVGQGNYQKRGIALASGNWRFQVAATQGPSATPVVPNQRTFEFIASGSNGATTLVPTTAPAATGVLRVKVEYDADRQSTLVANYVPIIALVTDAGSGEPVETTYTLIAGARDAAGVADSTTFHMAYPHAQDRSQPVGRYTAVVIVPRGGAWTIAVSVYDAKTFETQRIPVALTNGEVSVDVKAGELAGGGGQRSTAKKADVGEIIARIVHTFLGIAWFSLVGLLLLAAWPGRVGLTGTVGSAIERNERRIGAALVWVTMLMWVSGFVNLRIGTAFAPPLSGKQATKLFRVPYAQSYTVVLYLKIAAYLALTALVFPIIRRSHRTVERLSPDPREKRRGFFTMSGLVVLGGVVIVVCVTLLSALHVLSERTPIIVK